MKCPANRYKYSMRERRVFTKDGMVSKILGARANLGYWYRDGVKWNRHGAVK